MQRTGDAASTRLAILGSLTLRPTHTRERRLGKASAARAALVRILSGTA